jgi:4-oxalomesaconate tautomerase
MNQQLVGGALTQTMRGRSGQTAIPCVLMRGGTSRGPFFRYEDLPADPVVMKQVLLRTMGSPHVRQIDGVGGADPVTSKVAIIRKSARPDADVDYMFAQVIVDRAYVDTSPSCGNMLTAVAPFAVDEGLVEAGDPETVVRIWDVNTESLVEARVQTPGGELTYEGDLRIDGVNDPYAPIALDFKHMVGAKTGSLFPTGQRAEEILGVTVSCVDMAMPVVFVPAAQVGKTGYETKSELDNDAVLLARLEAIRLVAGQRMGFGDVTGRVIPKVALVAPPAQTGSIASRYFVPYAVATAYAVTGGVCLGTACCIEATVPAQLATPAGGMPRTVAIEHPQGRMFVTVEVDVDGAAVAVKQASLIRHARKLMSGHIYVPATVWAGREPSLVGA